MFTFFIFEMLSAGIGVLALGLFVIYLVRRRTTRMTFTDRLVYIPIGLFGIAMVCGFVAQKTYPLDFAMSTTHAHMSGGISSYIPFAKMVQLNRFTHHFERVNDIGADPTLVPQESQKPDADGIVRISLTAQEVIAEIAPGISFNYWTYNKQVPGPMLRVREGDTVELSLTNHPSSLHDHNIDLHAVTGPGGGATLTHVMPGETATFRWKALHPGLYVYHCAVPNVSTHNSHGQYGMILVDPKEGFAKVDKEFYVMQGELYTVGALGKKGLVSFDERALLDGHPNYIPFNGRLETTPRMHANVGDRIRLYVGNGGVNLISSFHIIGEIFDTVYPNANIGGALEHNVQTTAVLPGGASIVEFTVDVPGRYLLVDHALARMNKGSRAVLEVSGNKNPAIFSPVE